MTFDELLFTALIMALCLLRMAIRLITLTPNCP